MIKTLRTLPHSLIIRITLLLCAVACVWTPTLADTIQLKNGDRISGRLVRLTPNLCIFKTDLTATLQIDPVTITWLSTSEPVTFALKSGDRMIGTIINLRLGTFFIHSDQSGHLSLSSQEVIAVSRETGATSAAAADDDRIPPPNASDADVAAAQLAQGDQDNGQSQQDQQSGMTLFEPFSQILPLGQASNAEQNKWNEAARINTADAYRSYLEAYPQGAHTAKAHLNLGMMYEMYEDEDGYTEAARWYRKAAEQGLAEAQNNLGELYAAGRGVEQDEAEALQWYYKAAEQNNSWSQYNIGRMYEIGRSLLKDEAEAVRWYRKAAEQSNPFAQNNLGVMYDEGRGLAQNNVEAVSWYRKAAEQGFTPAQKSLEKMCARGVKEACS